MLEQSLRNRFSLVARRVSLGLLLRAHTRRVGSGWLFTEGLFPPTRSSALTINQFQRLDPTGNGPACNRRFFISTFHSGTAIPRRNMVEEDIEKARRLQEESGRLRRDAAKTSVENPLLYA